MKSVKEIRRARDIEDFDYKPWALESNYELLSNLSRKASNELTEVCIRIGTLIKEQYPGNDELQYEGDSLIEAGKSFESNCGFPELTDVLSDDLKYLETHIDNLKQMKEYDFGDYIEDLEEVLQDGKDAVLFDRSRWFNDVKGA